MMDMTWVDVVVFGLVVALVASRFVKFQLPKDPLPRGKRPKAKDVFGRFHLEDLKMPDMKLTDEAVAEGNGKKAPQKTALWDADRLKLGEGLEGVAKLVAIDPSFDESAFLASVKALFVTYYEAWNRKDEAAMLTMCAPAWEEKIYNRWQTGDWRPISIEDVDSVTIVATRTAGRTAVVTVDFVAKIREGEASRAVPKPSRQRWVLARAFHGDDPTWEIQTITAGVDA